MKKVLFVATVVKKHIMEFHIPYLKMFKEMEWETSVAARNDYTNPEKCNIPYCDKFYDIPFERKPFTVRNVISYKYLKKIIDENKYDIVHCHTPVGGVLTRIAARSIRQNGSKIFYTAHGFHFFSGAPLHYWLFYYPIEVILARWTDVLITINTEDYFRAKKFKAKRVEYIPGVGIDVCRFKRDIVVRENKRKELGFNESSFLLLSVGELIARKNHVVVIDAIAKLKDKEFFDKLHYIICGCGDKELWLKKRVKKLGIEQHVHFLGYRKDIKEICNSSDVFIFMSKQEGLPVALMEAMACGVPIICSKIRGNVDLIDKNIISAFCNNNAQSVCDKIKEFYYDEEIRNQIGNIAKDRINDYSLEDVLFKMKKIYLSEMVVQEIN